MVEPGHRHHGPEKNEDKNGTHIRSTEGGEESQEEDRQESGDRGNRQRHPEVTAQLIVNGFDPDTNSAKLPPPGAKPQLPLRVQISVVVRAPWIRRHNLPVLESVAVRSSRRETSR